MEPMKMKPIFKEYLWGGDALGRVYGKDIPSKTTSESWEVAMHKNGESIVCNGEFTGQPLSQAVRAMGAELLGDAVQQRYGERFPLLVKFLDCCDKLSIQVHPNDAYAAEHENGDLGKTEMWYVLDAKPDAKLIYGFAKDMTREEFAKAIAEESLERVLNYVDAKKGDCFFIPSGTLHALLDGLLIAEIQQNSDSTYRVYDYGRRDAQGNTRPLHVEKALDVTTLTSSKGKERIQAKVERTGLNTKADLVSCEYFSVSRFEVGEPLAMATDRQSFEILIFCDGKGCIHYDGGSVDFRAGDSFVVPAYLGHYRIEGACSFLKGSVPAE